MSESAITSCNKGGWLRNEAQLVDLVAGSNRNEGGVLLLSSDSSLTELVGDSTGLVA